MWLTERTTVTISDNWTTARSTGAISDPLGAVAPVSTLDFTIGPEATPTEAMERATAMVALSLPRLLDGAPDGKACATVQAVVTELIDVTARHKAGVDLVTRIVFDGAHITVSVGEMNRALPPSEEEPGLYLVHGVASEVGQYEGNHGGRVTWAAVPA